MLSQRRILFVSSLSVASYIIHNQKVNKIHESFHENPGNGLRQPAERVYNNEHSTQGHHVMRRSNNVRKLKKTQDGEWQVC